LPYAADHLKRAIADLKAQRKELDRKIQKLTTDKLTTDKLTTDKSRFAHVERLRGVQGIGPVTAAAAACCLQSRCLQSRCLQSRAFGHSDQFVAYISWPTSA